MRVCTVCVSEFLGEGMSLDKYVYVSVCVCWHLAGVSESYCEQVRV